MGVENVLPAVIAVREGGLLVLQVSDQRLHCMDSGEDGPVFACIRAEDVVLTRPGPHSSSARNRLTGTVVSVTLEGPLARVELDCGFPLVALITAQSASELALIAGDAGLRRDQNDQRARDGVGPAGCPAFDIRVRTPLD